MKSEKRGVGRPVIAEPKTTRSVRLTEAQWGALDEYAASHSMTRAVAVRKALRELLMKAWPV